MSTSEKKRVAVATFNQADGLKAALADLSHSGVKDDHICLICRGDALSKMADHHGDDRLAAFVDDMAVIGYYGGSEQLRGSYGRSIYRLLSSAEGEQSLGARLGQWIPKRQSVILEQSLENSCIVLWVCVRDPNLERPVSESLLRHSSQSVQVHEISD